MSLTAGYVKMVYYAIDVNKTKGCMIYHYWYFLDSEKL